jgi:hypothetical protein
MTCEFASFGHTASCRTCGLVLGKRDARDCPRRREPHGCSYSLSADTSDQLLPVVLAAHGGPVSPRPGRHSVSQLEHLTAPP